MANRPEQRSMTIVTACMSRDGLPAFALAEWQVTTEEIDNGRHYDLAAAQLLKEGYEEPFVHFSEEESPPFLHGAVRRHLLQHSPVPSAKALFSETH